MKNQNPYNPKYSFLTPVQATRILNVSLSTLKKFIYSGKLKTLKTPGGHHRILKQDLYRLFDQKEAIILPKENFNKQTLLRIVNGFVSAVDEKQRYCRGHSLQVAKISLKIARGLNFSPGKSRLLHLAALFHDVGKLGLSEEVLNKHTALNEQEYSLIKTHSLLGERLVNSIEPLRETSLFVRQHHERFDGKGYPDGLSKREIALESRIIAIADAFACMTAKDSYKQTLTRREAFEEISKNSGTQFDSKIAETFFNL
jgi:putative nucleotidyltransferase with HDIG domain/excisionase family DNA binding protein